MLIAIELNGEKNWKRKKREPEKKEVAKSHHDLWLCITINVCGTRSTIKIHTNTIARMHAIKVRSIFLLGCMMTKANQGSKRERKSSQKETERDFKTKEDTENWQKIDITMAHTHMSDKELLHFFWDLFVCTHTQYIVDLFSSINTYIFLEMWYVCRIELARSCVCACIFARALVRSHPHTKRANWMKCVGDAWCVEPISI